MTGLTAAPGPGPASVNAPAARRSTVGTSAGGDWPRTGRVIPWLIVIFLAMLYLIPFDSTTLPVSLPVDPALDRFVLAFLFLIWLSVGLAGNGRPRFKHAPINAALFVFVTVCVLSIAVNLRDLAWSGDLPLSLKQLSLVASYLVFFYIAASSIRSTEVTAFVRLAVGLAALTAIGTLYQYRTGSNAFAQLAHDLIRGATIALRRHGGHLAVSRRGAAGPTLNALADATLLSAAVPFALVLAAHSRWRIERVLMGAAVVLLLAGCVATGRKTALIVPVVSLIVLVAYNPRRYLRFWPGLVVAALAIAVVAPHSISSLLYQVRVSGSSTSTTNRTADFSAVAPYIESHLLFGRGYGSFDPVKYRILDDQMLGWLVQIGVLGALAYALVMFAAGLTVHRVARRPASLTDSLMPAVVAVSAGFLVSNFLYDAFGFRQGPYVFFFVAALGVAHAGRPSQTVEIANRRRAGAPP